MASVPTTGTTWVNPSPIIPRHRRAAPSWMLLTLLPLLVDCASSSFIRMNHLQTLHAHNTYHTCPLPNMVALFDSPIGSRVVDALANGGNPDIQPDGLQYGHEPLLTLVQDRGVRSIELDLYFDGAGERYAYRAGPKVAKAINAWSDDSFRVGGPDLFTAGSKVLHIPDIDFQSTCEGLVSCLRPIANWSLANPKHTPLFVTLEIKDWNPYKYLSNVEQFLLNQLLEKLPTYPNDLASTPDPDVFYLYLLQAEILTVFDRSQIFTPDMFRGNYTTLQDRIMASGWPTLEDVQGRVVFRVKASDQWNQLMETAWPGGQGSLLFREAAIFQLPYVADPNVVFGSLEWNVYGVPMQISDADLASRGIPTDGTPLGAEQLAAAATLYLAAVQQVVQAGNVMVRVPADSNTVQARQNWGGYAFAAAAGGAHFIHTDYPAGTVSSCGFTSPYSVYLQQTLPGTWNQAILSSVATMMWNGTNTLLATVCNPVSAPASCTSTWDAGNQPPAECTCYGLL